MSIHNTECRGIYNFTTTGYNVVNQESGNSRVLPAKNPDPPDGDGQPGFANFTGQIFPWCSNGTEIRDRAFVFRSGGAPQFYVFQKYDDPSNLLYWTRAPGPLALPAYPGLSATSRRASQVNVRIRFDNTPIVDIVYG
jgi:hypothetical protein